MKGKKTGGRVAGTPNKEKPIKALLRQHSEKYYTPTIEVKDENGKPTGDYISQFEVDLAAMKPADRAKLQCDILKYTTPAMQATAVDLTTSESNATLADRLKRLEGGEDLAPSE